MALKGLIIREPWIDEILAGRKTWELRSKPFRYRGEIALIRQGSGRVVGIAELTHCLAKLDEAAMRATSQLHGLPPDMIEDVLNKGWRIPWVLSNVRRLPSPVPYVHKPGAVITVELDTKAEEMIRSQLQRSRETRNPHAFERRAYFPLALGTMSGAERRAAMEALPHFAGESVRSITEADICKLSQSTLGSAPEIDPKANVEMRADRDDNQAKKAKQRFPCRLSLERARVAVTILAGAVSGICVLVWIGHVLFTGLTGALFSWFGIRWLLLAGVSSALMGIFGGDLIDPHSKPRPRTRR